jgi:two-component system cell cycle response regulator
VNGPLTAAPRPIHVLIVEDNAGDARLLEEVLKTATQPEFCFDRVTHLGDALHALSQESRPIDVLLLDLGLPDESGLETIRRISPLAAECSIVVMTGLDDEELGIEALRAGAQDYLIKGQLNGQQLLRALRYSVERRQAQASLKALTFRDELTGLYNRRGFVALAERQLKVAVRLNSDLLIVFADVDGLKQINDTLGHEQGDQAILDATRALNDSFRQSDIVARFGGDEFVVLALVNSNYCESIVRARIQRKLKDFQAKTARSFDVSLSLGLLRFHVEPHLNLQALVSQADALMYAQKHGAALSYGISPIT